jgi:nitrate/nitrite-specific signal transduction histidine kinase
MKNYLIDSRFQLKYTSYMLIAALIVAGVLGTFLWQTSQSVVEQSKSVASQSRKVADESRKVSDSVKMQIQRDPEYGADPELAKAFASASGSSDAEITKQSDAVLKQQADLVEQQSRMRIVIVGVMALLVCAFGLLGIYFTHKVAGPIYKMKLLLTQVGDGKLNFEGRLRKGDELQDFFETFATMTDKLKARQSKETENLSRAIEAAREGGLGDATLAEFARVRDEMKAAIDV